jgi:hypothetical protein
MPKVRDVCHHVRSKNAGPFWVTVDLFFDGRENFLKYRHAIGAEAVAALYDVDAGMVKCVPVENLNVVKISYPRSSAQGGIVERDMHCGQQFVRLLDVELA